MTREKPDGKFARSFRIKGTSGLGLSRPRLLLSTALCVRRLRSTKQSADQSVGLKWPKVSTLAARMLEWRPDFAGSPMAGAEGGRPRQIVTGPLRAYSAATKESAMRIGRSRPRTQ
jgi:hypothetical protein